MSGDDEGEKSESWEALPDGIKKENASIEANRENEDVGDADVEILVDDDGGDSGDEE
ncbi:hypothetical protein [Haloterrigena salinisoli]|uniref:hypothetical protein n=1 Tax=Haloterrigena salinisoli TaxID=3132747 RepID=UPI0030CEDA52